MSFDVVPDGPLNSSAVPIGAAVPACEMLERRLDDGVVVATWPWA